MLCGPFPLSLVSPGEATLMALSESFPWAPVFPIQEEPVK